MYAQSGRSNHMAVRHCPFARQMSPTDPCHSLTGFHRRFLGPFPSPTAMSCNCNCPLSPLYIYLLLRLHHGLFICYLQYLQ